VSPIHPIQATAPSSPQKGRRWVRTPGPRQLLAASVGAVRRTYRTRLRRLVPRWLDQSATRVAHACWHAPHELRRWLTPATDRVAYDGSTFGWRLVRLLLASSKDHAFLDRAWIPWMFHLTPPIWRMPLARRLLSLSPHFYVYQWTKHYPARCPRHEILELEHQRNAASRKEICDKLLRRYLQPSMTVLDFGCGPGFLAAEVGAHVAKVVGTDISRGVVGCARQMHGSRNVTFVSNRMSGLGGIDDRSIDLVYSFAVFQHLLKEQTRRYLEEFARVLKPGGMGVCHTILLKPGERAPIQPDCTTRNWRQHLTDVVLYELLTGRPRDGGWVKRRVDVRMVFFTAAELESVLLAAGFGDIRISSVSDLAEFDDDIGREQLVTFRR